jgi:uncharacterized protein YceH (UPF0502 family)
MIEDLKRSAANERDFLKKELQRKIDDLEEEIRELKKRFEDERNGHS